MKLEYGNMWDVWPNTDLFLITTNSTIKRNGALVMGRGIAKEARDRFSGLDKALGKAILIAGEEYGLLVSPKWPEKKIGAFQVKRHFKSKADLHLIQLSAKKLKAWAEAHPKARIDMNYPGIGWGHLKIEDVEPLIEILPDNIHVWRKKFKQPPPK